MQRKRSVWRIVGLVAAVGVIGLAVALAGFSVWALTPPPPMPEALAALQSDAQVTVVQNDWLEFTPTGAKPTTGLIFYPGGRVDPRAYAPAAKAIAAAGYTVVIAPMLLNLAVFSPNRADAVISAHPEVTTWTIGGHSLGGAMAANYVYTHPKPIHTLILWAAYPADGNSLAARTDLHVASISGERDGLATPADIDASRARLPSDAHFTAIAGGNHAQFGWYGAQSGDNEATISRADQQRAIVAATVATLAEAGK